MVIVRLSFIHSPPVLQRAHCQCGVRVLSRSQGCRVQGGGPHDARPAKRGPGTRHRTIHCESVPVVRDIHTDSQTFESVRDDRNLTKDHLLLLCVSLIPRLCVSLIPRLCVSLIPRLCVSLIPRLVPSHKQKVVW